MNTTSPDQPEADIPNAINTAGMLRKEPKRLLDEELRLVYGVDCGAKIAIDTTKLDMELAEVAKFLELDGLERMLKGTNPSMEQTLL